MWNKLLWSFIVTHNAGPMVTNSDQWQTHKQDEKTEARSSFRKPEETRHPQQLEAAVTQVTDSTAQICNTVWHHRRTRALWSALEREEWGDSEGILGQEVRGQRVNSALWFLTKWSARGFFHGAKWDSEGSKRCPVQSQLWLMKHGRRSTQSQSWQDDYPSVIVSCRSVESNNRTSLTAFGVFISYHHLEMEFSQ